MFGRVVRNRRRVPLVSHRQVVPECFGTGQLGIRVVRNRLHAHYDPPTNVSPVNFSCLCATNHLVYRLLVGFNHRKCLKK